jgi:ankyrin repeat protein
MQRLGSTLLLAGLLAAAAPLSAQDAQSRLWDSAISGDTVSLLGALSAGARVDSLDVRTNPNGRRALNWAAWNNRVPVIRILVARGATVNSTNLTGFTPLHHAAESGSMEAAVALLAAGADPSRLTGDGETPSDVARRRGFPAIADSLDAAARRR